MVLSNLGKEKELIANKVKSPYTISNLTVDFSKFKLTPICLRGKFNNHFKNDQHFCSVAAGFLGTILPKITSHTYREVCEGSSEGQILHFHTIDDVHRKTVREVLEEYNFSKQTIEKEKYVRESLFYTDCPTYTSGNCTYMPNDCFAVSFLDEEKLKETFCYTNSPQ